MSLRPCVLCIYGCIHGEWLYLTFIKRLDSIEDTDLRRRGTIYFKGDIIIKDSTLLTEVGYRYLRRELEERTSIQFVDISNFLKTNKVRISIIGTLLYHPWDLDCMCIS